jgi:hypothetical protein
MLMQLLQKSLSFLHQGEGKSAAGFSHLLSKLYGAFWWMRMFDLRTKYTHLLISTVLPQKTMPLYKQPFLMNTSKKIERISLIGNKI